MKARDIRENGIRIDVNRGLQITQQHGTMCIVQDGHRYDVDGYDMYMVEKQEPWPAIGSLDWAIQMMRAGEKICHSNWKDSGRISMVDENTVRWESDISETYIGNLDDWARPMSDKYKASGWQIYEPKPHYQVGDWVELNCYWNHQGQIKEMFCAGKYQIDGIEFNRSLPTFTITGLSGEFYYSSITRKLKPSEVILDFGSGIKGKVSIYQETSDGIWVGRHVIHMPDIAEPMRTIVLELLKAQEDK